MELIIKSYEFGDVLYYTSPQTNRKVPCVYIRDDHGVAVVFFQYAEWAARVNYTLLSE